MDPFLGAVILGLIVIAFYGNGWIETYWKGKADVAREHRLAAEEKTKQARSNDATARPTDT